MNAGVQPNRTDTQVFAFDLGGTWFRTAMVNGAVVVPLKTTPAISSRNCRLPASDLQRLLVDYLLNETVAAQKAQEFGRVGISLGAAVNARTDVVLGSAPLWGPAAPVFNLRQALVEAQPALQWTVLNDVTALALSLMESPSRLTSRKAAALTVSTGIGYRTIDLRTGHVPYDAVHGLQGEIGHLPVDVCFRNRLLTNRCDCGALNHVSAFSSGRGIETLLASLPEAAPIRDRATNADDLLAAFASAVRDEDTLALELLRLFTEPLARVLLYQATLDPEVASTVLFGGVVASLGGHYVSSLVKAMAHLGLYKITCSDPNYFQSRIRRGDTDGHDALRGAAAAARGALEGRGES